MQLKLPARKESHGSLSRRQHYRERYGEHAIESVSTAVLVVIFAVSFAYLEYYYIKDPALQISNGKVQYGSPASQYSRETKPIIGNMYQYHLFPMLFIFCLISFVAVWDDMTFRLLGKRRRLKAALVGCGNLITAIVVEDFAWYVDRWILPLAGDPKAGRLMQSTDWTSMHMGAINLGSFVIPNWYLLAIALAALAYYGGLRKSRHAPAAIAETPRP